MRSSVRSCLSVSVAGALLFMSSIACASSPSAKKALHSHHSAKNLKQNVVMNDGSTNFQQKLRRIGQGLVETTQPGQAYFDTLPSTTFDLALLEHRKEFPLHQIDMSGYLEFDAQYWRADTNLAIGESGNYLSRSGTGVYLTTFDIDMMSNMNDWTTAFVKFEEDGLGTSDEATKLKKAIITIGNLDKTPFFMTVGKSFLPFGTYSGGGAWSVPLTRSVFRPSEVPQILFGYYRNGFNSNIAFFQNGLGSRFVRDYVYSFYYTSPVKNDLRVILGGGYLNDMRGLPSGLGTAFKSTGVLSSAKRIPAWDGSAEFDFKKFDLVGEYLTALRQGTYNSNASTSGQTVATNGESQGRAHTWMLGAGYGDELFGKAMNYSVSYSRAYNMKGVPMGWSSQAVPGPSAFNGIKSSWIVSATRTITRNILASLEWQRGKTFANKSGWVVTADLSVYF